MALVEYGLTSPIDPPLFAPLLPSHLSAAFSFLQRSFAPSLFAMPARQKLSSTDLRPQSSRRNLSEDKPLPTPPSGDLDSEAQDVFPGKDSDAIYSQLRTRTLSRAGSVYSSYSISRESFTSHLQQLTLIKLPDPAALAKSIDTIDTAPSAARLLNDSSEDIQKWIQNAKKVLNGLDARDDIEWAAAAGKEALGEVDQAIGRFAGLVQVYLGAVEKLELRSDAADIPPRDLNTVVERLDKITREWKQVKDSLQAVKKQVELAMDWEDLRNNLLEETWQEAEGITRQIFEMEEDRHRASTIEVQKETVAGMDIREVEDILSDSTDNSTRTARMSSRVVFPRARSPSSPELRATNAAATVEEDTATLSLYARMQPLRASLDFLPIRIEQFEMRAAKVFPSAVQELKEKRDLLEDSWKQLQNDADTLKREIGEDRWVMIFRNCGRKAISLIDSVERSIKKLDEALDSNTSLQHSGSTSGKIEAYEAKKLHYCPAIERTIAVLDRGVKDRLTVNGEILRLQRDIQQKWRATLADVKNMDSTLDYYHAEKTQELRDSVSTVLSSDRSFQSTQLESLASSPPSSVEGTSRGTSRTRGDDAIHAPVETRAKTPTMTLGRERTTSMSTDKSSTPASRRASHLPIPSISTPPSKLAKNAQRTPLTRSSAAAAKPATRSVSSPISRYAPSVYSPAVYTPPKSTHSTPSTTSGQRPKWNASVNMNGSGIGHNFRPLAATEPSPYAKPALKKHTPSVRHVSSSLYPSPNLNTGSSPLSRRTSMGPGTATRSPSLSPSASTTRLSSIKSTTRRPSSLIMGSPASIDIASQAAYSPESPLDSIPPRPESRSMLPRPASRAGSAILSNTPAKKTSTMALRTKK